jgi:hypothetical protein
MSYDLERVAQTGVPGYHVFLLPLRKIAEHGKEHTIWTQNCGPYRINVRNRHETAFRVARPCFEHLNKLNFV